MPRPLHMHIRLFQHSGIALLLLLQTGLVVGEERVKVWTFEHAAQQALASHPAILSQQSSSAAARANLDEAAWQRYPTPSLATTKQTRGESNTVLTVRQPLWAGGRINANIDSAQSRLDASEASINETKRDVMLTLINAYTEALRLQARQEHAAQNVRELEKLLQLVSRRVAHEVTPPVDKGLAQSRLYQASNDLSSITQELSNAMMQLSQLVGKDVEKIVPLSADTGLPSSKADAQQQAQAYSPTLTRLAAEELAANAEITSRKSVYLPQLALTYEKTYGAYVPGNFPPGERTLLIMNIQPGAGLSSISGVDSATARRETARQNRETALRDLQTNVSNDWNQLAAARIRSENARLSSKISEDVFESYVRQYTTGRKGWLEVLNSAQESASAKMAVADSSAQVTRSALRLRLLTGNLIMSPAIN